MLVCIKIGLGVAASTAQSIKECLLIKLRFPSGNLRVFWWHNPGLGWKISFKIHKKFHQKFQKKSEKNIHLRNLRFGSGQPIRIGIVLIFKWSFFKSCCNVRHFKSTYGTSSYSIVRSSEDSINHLLRTILKRYTIRPPFYSISKSYMYLGIILFKGWNHVEMRSWNMF